MTAERLNKAKKLKLIVTAGVGSDHVDLNTAAAKGLTVSEVSGMIMNLTLPNTKNLILPCWVAGKHKVKPAVKSVNARRGGRSIIDCTLALRLHYNNTKRFLLCVTVIIVVQWKETRNVMCVGSCA